MARKLDVRESEQFSILLVSDRDGLVIGCVGPAAWVGSDDHATFVGEMIETYAQKSSAHTLADQTVHLPYVLQGTLLELAEWVKEVPNYEET